jgi:hypothetical protein
LSRPGETGQGGGPEAAATAEDALRLRAATALERGLGFVQRFGDAFSLLRTHALLGARPVADCVAAIEERTDRNGAVAPLGLAEHGEPGMAAIAAASGGEAVLGGLEALIVLADLDALGAPLVERLASHLARIQEADGAWGPEEAPEEPRLFATGMLGGLLARTRVVRPEVLARAGDYLASRFSPERVSGRSFPALAAFGAWYSSTADDAADAALQWIGRELERGHRAGVYDAVHTVRVLLHCDASAVPGSALVPAALLEALLGEQGEDGGFAELAEGPDRVRVGPTVDAMLGTIRLCGVI